MEVQEQPCLCLDSKTKEKGKNGLAVCKACVPKKWKLKKWKTEKLALPDAFVFRKEGLMLSLPAAGRSATRIRSHLGERVNRMQERTPQPGVLTPSDAVHPAFTSGQRSLVKSTNLKNGKEGLFPLFPEQKARRRAFIFRYSFFPSVFRVDTFQTQFSRFVNLYSVGPITNLASKLPRAPYAATRGFTFHLLRIGLTRKEMSILTERMSNWKEWAYLQKWAYSFPSKVTNEQLYRKIVFTGSPQALGQWFTPNEQIMASAATGPSIRQKEHFIYGVTKNPHESHTNTWNFVNLHRNMTFLFHLRLRGFKQN